MKIYQILFLIGEDRPGIVDDVSTILLNHNANIEESRMATLGGHFTIMALFSCPKKNLMQIENSFKQLETKKINYYFHEAHDPFQKAADAFIPLKLEVQAMDHPGIVQRLVHLLKVENINILSMDTHIINAPVSGTPLFNLALEAAVPATRPIAKIKKMISELALEEDLDLNFTI